jgi:putative peptidoglycan lipid II flippase
VALGVVLMPQLAAARAGNDPARYSGMLDWGLRLVVLLAVPSAVALVVFAQPLVAVLYHYGAFSANDVRQTTSALMGWGVGLVGVVAIKVLAPGYFASQDVKTPVRIAIAVLVLTQVLNYFLVPLFQHAALTLSIGLGAMVNALWLLIGLVRRGSYQPLPGWGRFALQVLAASALLLVFLVWAAGAAPWLALQSAAWQRIGLLAGVLVASGALYFVALWAGGLKIREFVRK